MIVRGIHAMGIGHTGPETGAELDPASKQNIIRLLRTEEGVYDRAHARTLSFVSSWAYSDLGTFAAMMSRRGLQGCDCVEIVTRNDALFFDTSAVLVQSPGRKLTILSFAGTQPTNAINWLTDVSAGMEPFTSGGRVHGGFHRAVRSMWPLLQDLLKAALGQRPICSALASSQQRFLARCDATHEPTPAVVTTAPESIPGEDDEEVRPALYITGHSLGGALAALAAAVVYAQADAQFFDRKPRDVRSWLRGVYTYGQPMVGDEMFARVMQQDLGKKVFRHVYDKDIVPRLPPRVMKKFEHFGQHYESSDDGWIKRERATRQLVTLGLSNVVGALAWFTQDVVPLSFVKFPFSWGDHSPRNYMRTSIESLPGEEFD
ncbi:lipase family protein [Sorangium sp. So ce1078]|uniref:lipase family protein n=1 Tax=Sorangium sp. So ce1078 TaxID=3133329 RepID=UPI003F61EF2C